MYHHTDQVLEEEEGEKDEGRAEASLKENTRKETRPCTQTKHISWTGKSYFSYVL